MKPRLSGYSIFCISVILLLVVSSQAGLVAYWPLNEGAGQIVADAAGNGNDGVLGDAAIDEPSDPSWVMDNERGKVLEWAGDDSPDQWVDLTSKIDSFKNLGQGSITAWIKIPAGGDVVDTIIAASDSGDGSSEFRFIGVGDNLWWDVRDENSSPTGEVGELRSGTGVADGSWHFVAVTVESSGDAIVYVDGEIRATGQEPFMNSVTNLDSMSLGRNVDSGGTQWVFKGRMSDVAIFGSVLSKSIITELSNGRSVLDIHKLVSNPYPEDGSSKVDTDTVLNWNEPGIAVSPTYTIYLDTNRDFPDGPKESGLTDSSYQPGTLTVGSTYYWRVDVSDGEVTTGSVWAFTTEGKAVDPEPKDGVTGVYTLSDLRWGEDGLAVSYDLLLGTAPAGLKLVGNVSQATYSLLTEMKGFTKYYWRVDTKDDENNVLVTGDLWSFTTGAKGALFEETALFVSGSEGYNTFRIPAIIIATNGDILAFCEGRVNSSSDSGNIDQVLRRSTDNGRTWSPLQVIRSEGTNTAGNPAPVVDHSTGRIYLLYSINFNDVHVMHSDDHGVNWSQPQRIHDSVSESDWTWHVPGPVHGIQLVRSAKAGRLIIAADHMSSSTGWGSHIIYSDDHGESWHLGGQVNEGTYDGNFVKPNECAAVELSDGRLYLNSRNHGPDKNRCIAYSNDGGISFGPPLVDQALVCPTVQGSAVRFSSVKDGYSKDRILFSNPASASSRILMTVRVSYDETKTWQISKLIYSGSSAYSDLAVLSDQSILCMYEKDGYGSIAVARFTLSWLTDGGDIMCKPPLLSDLNGDCIVNFLDFTLLADGWLAKI